MTSQCQWCRQTRLQQWMELKRRAASTMKLKESVFPFITVWFLFWHWSEILSLELWNVPMVLIAILYMTVVIKLKSQNIPGEGSANGREQQSRRQKNVLKMSIAIVLTFIVCWLPATIYWFFVLYPPDSTMTASCGFQYFALIVFCLGRFNSAINPCISFIFSGNYRQGLKNLSRCCFVCPRANQVAKY